ncbi:MAG TPA: DUF4145 domain-containing protein [Blastocatellia bacterium]|jgi:hypothetical protein
MSDKIVIDCPRCAVRVEAVAETWVHIDELDACVLVQCPSCKGPLVGRVTSYQDEWNNWRWETAERVWPTPTNIQLSRAIPGAARRDISDAQKCLSHGIYSAAAVLCGRALERLIKERVGPKTIATGLAELRTKGVIDQRLFDWAEALRRERNIGAHATEEEITKENAQDTVDFTIAIFDYVYTLSEKYDQYLGRRKQPDTASTG